MLPIAEGWIGLLTLTAMEIVLGIDNVIVLSILAAKLPTTQQAKARQFGLAWALLLRIGSLPAVSWVIGFTRPTLTLPHIARPFSGRNVLLIAGGLFLLVKSTREIHRKLEELAPSRWRSRQAA